MLHHCCGKAAPRRPFSGFAALCLSILLLSASFVRAEEDYSFDVEETEKKPWHLGGYAEFRPVLFITDRDAALYRLQYYSKGSKAVIPEYNARLQVEGWYEKGPARMYAKTSTDCSYSPDPGGSGRTALFEGYGTLKPSESLKIEAGKKNLRWGKGYAWNPVNFLDRGKDPGDPDLSIEGHVMLTADYIRSLDGPVRTLSITPVLLPVTDHVNEDISARNRLNAAVKVYLLVYDTDLDFIAAAGGSRSPRYGMDFSRNVSPDFEVHGEIAVIRHYQRQVLASDGTLREDTDDAVSSLMGIRHLTSFELTTILEYLHNGTGMDGHDMRTFYRFVHGAYRDYLDTGDDGRLVTARNLARGAYGRSSPMKDYLNLRLSQKEPFDILYLTPSLTVMVNLNDRGHSITPELVYTGVTNLELRLRAGVIRGGRNTEFGEKLNDYRFEFRAGYFL